MDENPENRDNARIKYKSPVTIENLKAGVIYQARMLDYSKYGLYFETDSLLRLGDGVKYSTDYDKQRSQNSNLKIVEDQRKHQRKPYSKSIVYATQNHLKKAITKNISPSGVFIETDDTLHVGQKITLAIPLKKAKTARIKAKVIWSSPDGFGVMFLSIKRK